MQMIRHDDIRADPRSAIATFISKFYKAMVEIGVVQNWPAFVGTSGHEVNWKTLKYRFESA